MKTPRDYQIACIADSQRSLAAHQSSLIVMATGLGKTYIFSRIADEWDHGNVLILAHRIELVDQAAASIAREIGRDPIIEQAERGCDPELLHQGGLIVVASIQTMISAKRLKKFRRFPFGLIIVDEAHRATSPSYKKLIDYYLSINPQCRVLGVTATPNRTDKTALGLIFQNVAFEMGIIEGIDQGWLVDIHQKFGILGKIDMSQIRMKRNEFGEMDFNPEDLARILEQEESLHEMTGPVLDTTADGKQAIIFTASVAHAHLWAMVFNRYRPGSAAAVDGMTDKETRKRHVAMFKDGSLQFLLNYGVFTEGFDAPNTSMVVMGRPTKSLLTYTQFLGRGTRPLPGLVDGIPTAEGRKDAIAASAKPFLTVLDFVGNSKHKIVSATDVLGGNFDVEEKECAAKRLAAKSGNVRAAINQARAAMILLQEEKRRQNVKVDKFDYQFQDVSPFVGGRGVVHTPKSTRGGATDGQISLLIGLGVKQETAEGYSRGQAGAVLASMKKTRCTDRQWNILKKYGLNRADFNVATASKKIDEIKANGWELP